ncbi:hypothetical protein [Gaetbulibacter saemankumensis]|uniref:hypothetical protein n=1 Tax=Gaetbulibacter saemankumensis TaxID=311208 RepID=UPI000487AFA8|nr:hypothetical protein [Gaetbulibacter saemankumensis]
MKILHKTSVQLLFIITSLSFFCCDWIGLPNNSTPVQEEPKFCEKFYVYLFEDENCSGTKDTIRIEYLQFKILLLTWENNDTLINPEQCLKVEVKKYPEDVYVEGYMNGTNKSEAIQWHPYSPCDD